MEGNNELHELCVAAQPQCCLFSYNINPYGGLSLLQSPALVLINRLIAAHQYLLCKILSVVVFSLFISDFSAWLSINFQKWEIL